MLDRWRIGGRFLLGIGRSWLCRRSLSLVRYVRVCGEMSHRFCALRLSAGWLVFACLLGRRRGIGPVRPGRPIPLSCQLLVCCFRKVYILSCSVPGT